MNDRFKFRVWDIDRKTYDVRKNDEYRYMIDSDAELLREDDCWDCMYQSITPLESEKYIIEQCTGFKDKHGTLIYENDLLECIYGKTDKIYWDDEGACFIMEIDQSTFNLSKRIAENSEIIGNIHERRKA